jgi:hypothetical protein
MKNPSLTIRQLIGACVDDEFTLRHESENVDVRRKSVLTRLATERSTLIDELRRARGDAKTPGSPERSERRSWMERMREFLRDLRVFAGGSDSGDAIAECRNSRDRAESAYSRAAELPWAKEGLALLREHARRLEQARGELIAIQF